MSSVLCAFLGGWGHGDILWSLPVARECGERHGVDKVDFCFTDARARMHPLIQRQPYIDKAIMRYCWSRDSMKVDVPEEVVSQYPTYYDLTYRSFPNMSPLTMISSQQGITLQHPIPFLEVDDWASNGHIAYGFNHDYQGEVMMLLSSLRILLPQLVFVDTAGLSWLEAASCIKSAKCFIGNRSGLAVVAHGVKQDNLLIYEPNQDRQNDMWGCPCHTEIKLPATPSPELAAHTAYTYILEWIK